MPHDSYQKYQRKHCVSIWFGNHESHEQLDQYLRNQFGCRSASVKLHDIEMAVSLVCLSGFARVVQVPVRCFSGEREPRS